MSTAYRFNCFNAPWGPRSADETPALLILKHETAHTPMNFLLKEILRSSFPLPMRSHYRNVEKGDISCMRASNESSFISQSSNPRSTADHRSSGETHITRELTVITRCHCASSRLSMKWPKPEERYNKIHKNRSRQQQKPRGLLNSLQAAWTTWNELCAATSSGQCSPLVMGTCAAACPSIRRLDRPALAADRAVCRARSDQPPSPALSD